METRVKSIQLLCGLILQRDQCDCEAKHMPDAAAPLRATVKISSTFTYMRSQLRSHHRCQPLLGILRKLTTDKLK